MVMTGYLLNEQTPSPGPFIKNVSLRDGPLASMNFFARLVASCPPFPILPVFDPQRLCLIGSKKPSLWSSHTSDAIFPRHHPQAPTPSSLSFSPDSALIALPKSSTELDLL